MNKLAPIVLFVYNRPWHSQQTIEALQKNDLAIDSELFIYSDGPKDTDSVRSVGAVRMFLKSVKGFKKVTIIERENNWGLANSIIDGVTNIIKKYDKIIVLEDDLLTSSFFLKFMNEALEFYQENNKIWHISGWIMPIKNFNTLLNNDIFLYRVMHCSGGWATWNDRWQYFEKNTDKLVNEFSKNDKIIFNLDGVLNDYWGQVIANKKNKNNTWAIFWYASIFKNNGLCLNPSLSYVKNIGHDGSGVHCYDKSYIDNEILNTSSIPNFNIKIEENQDAVELIKKYHKSQRKPLIIRISNKLSKIIIKKNVMK